MIKNISPLKISVIIPSKNRVRQLQECLSSILKNKVLPDEIIVIDQSDNPLTVRQMILDSFPRSISFIKILCDSSKGISCARNKGIKNSSGDISVFTDDDCVVTDTWISAILSFYTRHPEVYGLFGKTLEYKPKFNNKKINPATFSLPHTEINKNPNINISTQLGIGNNMSFRKRIFNIVGLFTEWLGVGSISENGAEEGEFAYRALYAGLMLAYTPDVFVYHNRWLTQSEYDLLRNKYEIGNIAFYLYWSIHNRDRYKFNQLKTSISFMLNRINCSFMHILKKNNPKHYLILLLDSCRVLLKGTIIGLRELLLSRKNVG